MTRRYFMSQARFFYLALIASMSDLFSSFVLAAPSIVPVTITVLMPDQTPIRFRTKVSRNTQLSELVNRMAEATDTVVISGTNPTWEDPKRWLGTMLLQINLFRNADMPEDPDFPSDIVPDAYWMILGGPTTKKRHGKIVKLPAQEIVRGRYLVLGPQVSLGSIQIDWMKAQGMPSRRSAPQYVLWLGDYNHLTK